MTVTQAKVLSILEPWELPPSSFQPIKPTVAPTAEDAPVDLQMPSCASFRLKYVLDEDKDGRYMAKAGILQQRWLGIFPPSSARSLSELIYLPILPFQGIHSLFILHNISCFRVIYFCCPISAKDSLSWSDLFVMPKYLFTTKNCGFYHLW